MDKVELEKLRDEILNAVKVMMQTTGQVTQYIGARYVPLFATPIEWDDEREYEPLTIVTYQGDSYTSRQFVPKGIRIADAHYWALTGNYNAQIQQYRQEVQAFDARIDANMTAIQAEADRAANAEATKAPIDHASTVTTYGIGTDTEYGHVKLVDNPSNFDLSNGIAVTPKALYDSQVFNVFKGGGKLLNFGDSIAKGQDAANPYYKLIAATMKLDAIDYSVNGAMVWDKGEGNTLSQVEKAISEITDTDSVKMILFEGGVNNTYNTEYSFPYSQTYDCLNKLKKAFNNAKIICLPMVWASYPFGGILSSIIDKNDGETYNTSSMNRVNCLNAMVNAANGVGVLCLSNIYQMGIGTRNWYVNFIHPNQNGHTRIFEWILELISGGKPAVFEKATTCPIDSKLKNSTLYAQCIDSTVTFGGSFKAAQNINEYLTTAFKLPTFAIIGTNPFNIPMYNFTQNTPVLAYTNGYNDYLETEIAINAVNWKENDLIIVPPITYTIGSI